jgi:hypothetical protein
MATRIRSWYCGSRGVYAGGGFVRAREGAPTEVPDERVAATRAWASRTLRAGVQSRVRRTDCVGLPGSGGLASTVGVTPRTVADVASATGYRPLIGRPPRDPSARNVPVWSAATPPRAPEGRDSDDGRAPPVTRVGAPYFPAVAVQPETRVDPLRPLVPSYVTEAPESRDTGARTLLPAVRYVPVVPAAR